MAYWENDPNSVSLQEAWAFLHGVYSGEVLQLLANQGQMLQATLNLFG